jgi:hypothetical protein
MGRKEDGYNSVDASGDRPASRARSWSSWLRYVSFSLYSLISFAILAGPLGLFLHAKLKNWYRATAESSCGQSLNSTEAELGLPRATSDC